MERDANKPERATALIPTSFKQGTLPAALLSPSPSSPPLAAYHRAGHSCAERVVALQDEATLLKSLGAYPRAPGMAPVQPQ